MNDQRFGEIRSLLHSNPPSEQLWKQLTSLLWGWRNLLPAEMMASYCESHMSDWPDDLRTISKGWLKAILRGDDNPLFSLARTLHIKNKQINQDKLSTIAACRSLSKLSSIDLSSNRLVNTVDDDHLWIEDLKQAPFLDTLEHLYLHMCSLNADAIERLSEVNLQNLKSLELDYNFQIIGLLTFFKSAHAPRSLEHLSLLGNVNYPETDTHHNTGTNVDRRRHYLRPNHLEDLLESIPTLRSLDLTMCKFDPLPLARQHHLAKLQKLSISIDFSQNTWLKLIQDPSHLPELHELHIRYTGYSQLDLDELWSVLEQRIHTSELTHIALPQHALTHIKPHLTEELARRVHFSQSMSPF